MMILLLAVAAATPEAVAGLTARQLAEWEKGLSARGLRLASISVSVVGGKAQHSALATPNPEKAEVVLRLALTGKELDALTARLGKEGHRMESLCPYTVPEGRRFAAFWMKDGSLAHSVRFGLNAAEYQKLFDQQAKAGLRPACVQGYLDGKQVRFAAVFHQSSEEWTARHGLPEARYPETVTSLHRDGYRLAFVSAFSDGKGLAFNLVAVRDGRKGVARHGLSRAELEAELAAQARAGLEPAGVSSYVTREGVRYAALWASPRPRYPEKLPITGEEVPALAAFDRAMTQFLREREILAGALCVSRNGKIVLSRGYGYMTRSLDRPVPADTPFRIASITKPITAAAIVALAEKGKLRLEGKAFDLLGIDLPPGKKADPRLGDITIRHLLQHRGGFDRDAKPLLDPMFQHFLIQKELGLDGPPGPRDIVRFMNGRKLDFDPGSRVAYSNYGYCVLGLIVEKASGEAYEAHVQRLLAPLGIRSVALARSLPKDRSPREPAYHDPGLATNALTGKAAVPWPDGGFFIEAMAAHGGLISSAPDLARFTAAYWFNGQPRKGPWQGGTFFGSLSGTWAMAKQRPDGVDIIALFNQRSCPPGKKPEEIEALLNKAADSIKAWP
jgi:N-acyl-D-amino-acid deacylase